MPSLFFYKSHDHENRKRGKHYGNYLCTVDHQRTYMSVPKVIRPQVRDLLIELDLDDLLPENERPPKAEPDKAEADS